MVHINLLPADIRKDIEKKISTSRSGIPLEIVVGSIGGVFLVLVVLHVVLMTLSINRLASYKAFEKQWKTLEVRRNFIDSITKQLQDLKTEETDINTLFSQTFHEWSPMLNHFSLDLPKGIWFTKMTVEPEDFEFQGSAVAREIDEIVSVHSYVNKLRGDISFKILFKDFVLDSVQKRKVQKVDVADFIIKSKINSVSDKKKIEKEVIQTNLAKAGSESIHLNETLPGIPEDAKANTKVADKKPYTSVTR